MPTWTERDEQIFALVTEPTTEALIAEGYEIDHATEVIIEWRIRHQKVGG